MVESYRYNTQFIVLMIILYVLGVWGGGVIYVLFPLIFFLLGLKKYFFELIALTILILILSDYIPIKGATVIDLKFAKDLKFIAPIFLAGFIFYHKSDFDMNLKLFYYFIPFFIVVLIGLSNSIKFNVGLQKSISYILMYFSIPIYIIYLHKKERAKFWNSLITFMIGLLFIGLVLGVIVPKIGIHSAGRFKGIFGNPNGLGVFIFLVFSLYIILKELKLVNFSKREHFGIMAVILISLLWCESRNTIMSVFLFSLANRLIKINWLFSIITIVSLIVFQDYIYEFFIAIISFFGLDSYFRVHTLEKGSGRTIAWVFAWEEIQNNFFIGGGFGHDENVMRPNYYWLERKGHNGGVHNSYLSMWFDSGIIGVIFYYLGLTIALLKSMKNTRIAIAFLTALLFNINYESWVVGSLNPFTIIFLIIITIFVMQLEPNSENELKSIQS